MMLITQCQYMIVYSILLDNCVCVKSKSRTVTGNLLCLTVPYFLVDIQEKDIVIEHQMIWLLPSDFSGTRQGIVIHHKWYNEAGQQTVSVVVCQSLNFFFSMKHGHNHKCLSLVTYRSTFLFTGQTVTDPKLVMYEQDKAELNEVPSLDERMLCEVDVSITCILQFYI